MIVLAIIRRDYELLLIKTSVENENEKWTLPYFEISDDEDPSDLIIEKCKTYDVTIEPIGIYFRDILSGQEVICFDTRLFSYTYSSSSENAFWIPAINLEKLLFVDAFSVITDKLINEYRTALSVSNRIENIMDDFANAFNMETAKTTTPFSCSVFVKNDYGGYCPFIFSVEYIIHPETNLVDYRIIWPITRMFADGDKTDLYVLFSSTMAILLKCIHQQDVYIDYLSLFNYAEINAATLVFTSNVKASEMDLFISDVEKGVAQYLISLMLFEQLVGSFSLIRDDNQLSKEYEDILNTNENFNLFAREEHQFYGNVEDGIFVIHINNHVYCKESLAKYHQWQIVEGIDGKILHQIDRDKSSYNFISNDTWDKVQKLINLMEMDNYTIVCQQNFLYLLASNDIWIFEGDFSEYQVCQERDKIYDRQTYENSILHFSRTFKWKYPIDPRKFENMIADLIETEPLVDSVRLVGNTNQSDGGRDLLIFKRQMNEFQHYTSILIVGQCKAYQKTVNKSHVQDIRDMLEYYGAEGFFLAVSSIVSSPLVDHLCKLKEIYDVDWWTEREIFKKLRQHPSIANSYEDIIDITEKEQ